MPQARHQRRHILQMKGRVRRPPDLEAKRLRSLEEENAKLKLKKLLAEAMPDNAV